MEKIFFTIIGTACYLYLFLTVGGSFDLQLGFIERTSGGPRSCWRGSWRCSCSWWRRCCASGSRNGGKQAKVGGQILMHPRTFLGRVVLPQAISWAAGLGIIAVFLGAYSIPVSFHTIMRVVASNSIANATAVTPGGAGVTQAFNVVSLRGVTSASNATAYSVAQQLMVTVWSIVLAIVLLVRAFGWSGGKTLVSSHTPKRARRAPSSRRRAKPNARPSTTAPRPPIRAADTDTPQQAAETRNRAAGTAP